MTNRTTLYALVLSLLVLPGIVRAQQEEVGSVPVFQTMPNDPGAEIQDGQVPPPGVAAILRDHPELAVLSGDRWWWIQDDDLPPPVRRLRQNGDALPSRVRVWDVASEAELVQVEYESTALAADGLPIGETRIVHLGTGAVQLLPSGMDFATWTANEIVARREAAKLAGNAYAATSDPAIHASYFPVYGPDGERSTHLVTTVQEEGEGGDDALDRHVARVVNAREYLWGLYGRPPLLDIGDTGSAP